MFIGVNVNTIPRMGFFDREESRESRESIRLVEYDFFVKNEIEISKLVNEKMRSQLFPFITIKEYEFIKVGEYNKHNLLIASKSKKLLDNKRHVILKYNYNTTTYEPFINSIFNFHNDCIFVNLIFIYEEIVENLFFLREKCDIRIVDFSSKNLLYCETKGHIYFQNFEKCLKNKDVVTSAKINDFIKIIENIDFYSNKHFDLFLAKQIVVKKDLFLVFSNSNIVDEYLDNLFFLKSFPENTRLQWKTKIMSEFQKKREIYKNIVGVECRDETETPNWQSYLRSIVSCSDETSWGWSNFSLNCLFLNISIAFIRVFQIQEKDSILHKYIEFLMNNMMRPINNKGSDNFRYYFEENYEKDYKKINDMFNFNKLSREKQCQLYDLLLAG
jgi:hypothetical protein